MYYTVYRADNQALQIMKKLYNLDITISNDHGELLDIRRVFESIDEVDMFMTNVDKMHELWCEAEKNGHEDGILYEELFDSKEEHDFDKDVSDEYQEILGEKSPLNNPANFAN